MTVSSNFKEFIYENFSKKSLFPTAKKEPNLGELTLSAIIIFSSITLVLETEPIIYQKYIKVFQILDFYFFFTLFSLEYILRLLFCGTLKKYQALRGKIRYIFSVLRL